MKIVDTYQRISDCFIDGVFNIENWRCYSDSISTELVIKLKNDIADYDFQKNVLPVLNDVVQNPDKLDIAHRSFISLTNGLSEKLQDVLQTDLNVAIIFYLGLCNSAGWATELDGQPAVLLGAEKIIELSWYNKPDMAGLVYHELGHIWHNKMRSNIMPPFENGALWQLYREGIAMYAEQLLIGDKNFYHQDKDGWLNWCQANKKDLCRVYLNRMIKDESICDFFGDWNKYEGKSDVGYYLGCELVKELAHKYSIAQLANLEQRDIYDQLISMTK